MNCKGPMSCWMFSTEAIKDPDIQLPGEVLLSTLVGETGGAPVDEYEAPNHDSHDLGARYVASHGGLADYAIGSIDRGHDSGRDVYVSITLDLCSRSNSEDPS